MHNALTIIIPTIGRNKTFQRAMSSAINASINLVNKIIIVDNSQSAEFSNYIDDIILENKNVIITQIRHFERVSMADSWNSALEIITTPWVLYLHDDDELLNIDLYSDLIEMELKKNSNLGFLTFNFYSQYQKKLFQNNSRKFHRWPKLLNTEALLEECPKLVSTIINVKQLRNLNGFADEYGNFLDLIVFLELFKYAGAKSIQVPLGVYHLHDENESGINKRGAGYGNFIPIVCKRFFELFEDNSIRKKFIILITNFAYPEKDSYFRKFIKKLTIILRLR